MTCKVNDRFVSNDACFKGHVFRLASISATGKTGVVVDEFFEHTPLNAESKVTVKENHLAFNTFWLFPENKG